MGYGFLEFESKEQANEALEALNGKLLPKTENKTFKLNWAIIISINQCLKIQMN